MDTIKPAGLINQAIGITADTTGYVDVIKLAKLLDIDVFLGTNSNEDFNAKIELDKASKRYTIIVNPDQPFERQRFSIAHELAHFVLHRDLIDRFGSLNRDPDDIINKAQEQKADELAAEVLMPTLLLEKYTNELGLDKKEEIKKNIIEKVASYFRVSRTVAAIKLRELKFFVPFTSFA